MKDLNYFDRFYNRFPYLYISNQELLHIRSTYTLDDVYEKMKHIIQSYEPPYKNISYDDARDDFYKLKSLELSDLLVTDLEWQARIHESIPTSSTYVQRNTTGNAASDFFHQRNRWSTGSIEKISVLEAWYAEENSYARNPQLMRNLVSFLLRNKWYDYVDRTVLEEGVRLRWYIPSQFKPSAAKCIYEYYNAKNVLDFSAGWGDRLCGFYASDCTESYVGIDPSSNNYPIYLEQIQAYDSWNESISKFWGNSKHSTIIKSPAEDADLKDYHNEIDFVFTSPPYFNREWYSEEETQSFKRYNTLEYWIKNFLFATIDNVNKCIKKNGILAINITDLYNRKSRTFDEICNPMIQYVVETLKYEQLESVGMGIGLRPNTMYSKQGIDKNFAEPIFVFQKK